MAKTNNKTHVYVRESECRFACSDCGLPKSNPIHNVDYEGDGEDYRLALYDIAVSLLDFESEI